MEYLVLYIDKDEKIQQQIIQSNNNDLIDATYSMLLHYNCSLEYFLKNLFYQEYNKYNTLIFRNSSTPINIIIHFLNKFGCNFQLLAMKICKVAIKEKAAKNNKRMENAINKVIKYIDELFVSYLSDTFIDFCCEMNVYINTQNNVSDEKYIPSEKLICSFLFFRIFIPKIMEASTNIATGHNHIIAIVKLLNLITVGTTDKLYQKYMHHNKTIINIVARALMLRKKSKYCFEYTMPKNVLVNKNNILIKELRKLDIRTESVIDPAHKENIGTAIPSIPTKMSSESNLIPDKKLLLDRQYSFRNLPQFKRLLNSSSSGGSSSGSGSGTNSSNDSSKFPPPLEHLKSFEYLLNLASIAPIENSTKNNLKYFLLWSCSEVHNMAITHNINAEFIEKWNINGEYFMQLKELVLREMGISNTSEIKKILDCIHIIKKIAIYDKSRLGNVITWNTSDICIWLILSNLSHLVVIFTKYNITIDKILELKTNDYLSMGITIPKDIYKLALLKQEVTKNNK